MTQYTIKKGDTLAEIAKHFHVSVRAIEKANPGIDPKNLEIGDVIKIPDHEGGGGDGGIPGSTGGTDGGGSYVDYKGSASDFPDLSKWARYGVLWAHNSKLMNLNDTEEQVKYIHEAIEAVAKESGVDVRVILCIIMQESGGNVHIKTTDNGVRNPGIMQSHDGVSFDEKHPRESIFQMVRDGTEGTKTGPGLKQLRKKYGNYYEAARAYNSGDVNPKDLNDPMAATWDYVQKVANRLMGHVWNGM